MALYNPERLALEVIAATLEPPPPVGLLAWAEANVVFEGGAFKGLYNRALFPFFDEILRALSPMDPCRFVTLMSSAQVGKTALAGVFALGTPPVRAKPTFIQRLVTSSDRVPIGRRITL